MAKLKLFKRIIIRDRSGRVRYDSGLVPSDSFVIAFLKAIYGSFRDSDVSIKNTSGGSSNVRPPSYFTGMRMDIDAPDDSATFGLVVGTGTTAEDNEDYKLDTQIAHGTGAGQLDYGTHSFTAPSVVGDNVDMVVSRDFYNGSGASITVNEIGIYGYAEYMVTPKFCIARDVLSTPIVVEDTKTLTVQYTVRTTV